MYDATMIILAFAAHLQNPHRSCLFMLKQRPAEIHHNLRKRKVKNALLFPQALSGFDSHLYKKTKSTLLGAFVFLEQMRGIEPPL